MTTFFGFCTITDANRTSDKEMKLYQLIQSNNWLSVELTLLQLYPDQEKMIDQYRCVFEKLKITEPTEYDLEIVLTEYQSDPNFDTEEYTYIDVSGQKKLKDLNAITDSYALEFVEWDKWLGMDLATVTTENFSDLEIISHCLYEMTFISYDESEIQDQRKSINDVVEDYKELSDDEKKAKTISLEEYMRQLDKKKGDQQL